jgi:hypothetical protein
MSAWSIDMVIATRIRKLPSVVFIPSTAATCCPEKKLLDDWPAREFPSFQSR